MVGMVGMVGVVGFGSTGAAQDTVPDTGPPLDEVLLTDLGDGFELVEETNPASEAITRTFNGPAGWAFLAATEVGGPEGIGTAFAAFTSVQGQEFPPEPALDLAAWMVDPGEQPGADGITTLHFAGRNHLFMFALALTDASPTEATEATIALAREQVERDGGPPLEFVPVKHTADDTELLPYLLERPPDGFGLDGVALTLAGPDDVSNIAEGGSDVAGFLNDRAKTVVRAWGSDQLGVGLGITQYPYDIFAGVGLTNAGDHERVAVDPAALAALPDAVVFREPEDSTVGVAFRRGDILVTVLATYVTADAEATATELAIATANEVAARLPAGGTSPYEFPPPLSKLAGLAFTAGLVVVAVAGSRIVARLRARRIRKRWKTDTSSAALPAPAPDGTAVPLDADAANLRRRGHVVAAGQLVFILTGVLALAGDFAWTGVAVAIASLVAGLLFSRWWLRREHALLGPAAPPRAFRTPRPMGAVIGISAFAVLGAGAAFFLKGLRYMILKPSLAQLRWVDLFGISPRQVGVLFTVAGLVLVAFGAVLWRIARAVGRARVATVLHSDPRPPVLYLRSFGDDAVPLPIIASARRPLFEFFSIRGADPFEESVAWELDSYGPVIAVGRPGGSLSTLGAAREHLPSDAWHEQVADRMGQSGCIVLAPGETAGLAWELAQIVEGGHLGKTIFVFPPLAPSELARRWEHTAGILTAAGRSVGPLPVTFDTVHTVQIGGGDHVRATFASVRDEATYRTAVDRALEQPTGATPAATGAQPLQVRE